MVVVVDGGGDSGVVVVPLGLGDLTIVVLVSEVGKELEEGLILCDLSRDDLGVSVARVAHSEVSSGDTAGAIGVELAEGGVDDGLSSWIEAASHHHKEFVKVDVTVFVGIVSGKKEIGLLLGQLAAALVKANEELLGINLSVAVVIDGSEHSAETSDGLGASGGHLGLNFGNDYKKKRSVTSS